MKPSKERIASMMDERTFAELERAMEEEHSRERELLRYLKERLVHGRTNGSSPMARAAATLARTRNHAEPTIIDRVASIMTGDPSQKWDTPKMKAHLSTVGVTAKAATINRIFRKLVKRGIIRRVREGEGRNPHVYQAVKKQEGQKQSVSKAALIEK